MMNFTALMGMDTGVFSGAYSEYTVAMNEHVLTVTDGVTRRDGKDTLFFIETLQFSDQNVDLKQLTGK